MGSIKHHVEGMTCEHCENSVKHALKGMKKIKNLKVDHVKGILSYDSDVDYSSEIIRRLSSTPYSIVAKKEVLQKTTQFTLIMILILAFSGILYNKFSLSAFSTEIGLSGAFIFGLITSFHCMGMCGGIAVTQIQSEVASQNITKSLIYNFSRIMTYALIGGTIGAIGQGLSLSFQSKGLIFLAIGGFMLVMGAKNIGLIKLRIPVLKFGFSKKGNKHSSVITGVLNGFMPCGPLQTMQVIALSTMSFMGGFTMMLAYGLGTVPMMFLFANVGSLIGKKYHGQLVKASGILVIVMAMSVIGQGVNALGLTVPVVESNSVGYATVVDGVQIVDMEINGYYDISDVKVKKDMPVRIVMNATRLNGCIDTITIPEYNIAKGLILGENIMEFTPTSAGNLRLTCWMSMVSTSLEVTE